MSIIKNYSQFEILTIKDLSILMNISLCTSQRYYADIKNHFNTPKVTYSHFLKYFSL
jgi:hypothetical protein